MSVTLGVYILIAHGLSWFSLSVLVSIKADLWRGVKVDDIGVKVDDAGVEVDDIGVKYTADLWRGRVQGSGPRFRLRVLGQDDALIRRELLGIFRIQVVEHVRR
eukprot:7615868-Pyramimonas_sp.AAC.1